MYSFQIYIFIVEVVCSTAADIQCWRDESSLPGHLCHVKTKEIDGLTVIQTDWDNIGKLSPMFLKDFEYMTGTRKRQKIGNNIGHWQAK
jgi:hypothetical protein